MRRRIAVLLPVLAAAAAVAFLLRKLRGGGGDAPEPAVASREPREDAGAPPSDAPATESVESTYSCEGCGTEYRFSGEGRHRVFWKADASKCDPVIDGKCVECGRPLPGHHPAERDGDGSAEGSQRAGDAGGEETVAEAGDDVPAGGGTTEPT